MALMILLKQKISLPQKRFHVRRNCMNVTCGNLFLLSITISASYSFFMNYGCVKIKFNRFMGRNSNNCSIVLRAE